MWESIINALSNLFSSGATSAAANSVSSGVGAAGDLAGYTGDAVGSGGFGNLPSWLSGIGSQVAANPMGALGGLAQAGTAGMGLLGSIQGPPGMPKGNFTGVPTAPQGMDPGKLKGMISNRQAQGIYSGGATTPESMAALLGDQMTPEQIQQMMQVNGSY